MKILNSRILSILMQALAWMAFAFSFLLYTPNEFFGIREIWEKQILFTAMLAGAYYFNSERLIPKFLEKGRILSYVLMG